MNIFYLYLLFIKYGLLSFGGGYVLVTLFIHDLVEKYQLISSSEFANLLAIAQMTPGPIGINTATYVGYKTFGIAGGIIATAGLLTPAVVLVILAAYYFKRCEKSPIGQGLLYGMRPAALGLIISAVLIFANISIFSVPVTVSNVRCWIMGNEDIGAFGVRWVPLLIAVAGAVAIGRFKLNVIYIIAAAALLGALFIR
ncbi:MAG: chromate transporter [Lentisphaerae bacterium]|nr:chromate transporter [Lentisphaerota bacterium]